MHQKVWTRCQTIEPVAAKAVTNVVGDEQQTQKQKHAGNVSSAVDR